MRAPLGDQSGSSATPGLSSARAAPVRVEITYRPPPTRAAVTGVPLGDQAGAVRVPSLVLSLCRRVPSAWMVHTAESHSSQLGRTKAIRPVRADHSGVTGASEGVVDTRRGEPPPALAT